MNSSRLANGLQIVGNFGVILGLLFVGFQLYQDRELKRAELSFAAINSSIQVSLAAVGENPQLAVAKSVGDPGSLTEADLFELSRLYSAEMYVNRQIYLMQLFGLFPEGLGERLNYVFRTKPGVNFLNSELDTAGLNPVVKERWLAVANNESGTEGLGQMLQTLKRGEIEAVRN